MRALVQRVARAEVQASGQTVAAIGPGLLVLLGVHCQDTAQEAHALAHKLVTLRIFEDEQGKMNLDVRQTGGAVLVVSQFTLYADCRKGRRPSFTQAAPPERAEPLYRDFIAAVARCGVPVAQGIFGARMQVHLVNDGPVTLLLESPATTS
ncbi:MAG: D-aminoacyl-tRNA deacylase [Candidatus Tectimicrobiota bacterium]|nr:MAG: D-aminoacyl-tRNA deacylase [Candidatus Tectomicrobia bacterium]